MDKISGIIPASPRTQVADVATSQPARPGAPMTGRPMGRNSLGDRIMLSKELERLKQQGELPELAPKVDEPPTYKNTPENSKRKIVEDLNKNFFLNPKELARENAGVTRSEEILQDVEETGPILPQRAPQESHAPPMSRGDTPL